MSSSFIPAPPPPGPGPGALAAAGRDAGLYPPPPSSPLPPPDPRDSTNWHVSMTTTCRERLALVSLSSHWSSFRRPSIRIGLPLEKYWLRNSAVFPHASQSMNIVSSRCSPSGVRQRRLHARPSLATAWLVEV